MAETIGEMIHLLRRRKHWSLRDLAKESGVSPATLSRMERDDDSLQLSHYVKVARVFGLRVQVHFEPKKGEGSDG